VAAPSVANRDGRVERLPGESLALAASLAASLQSAVKAGDVTVSERYAYGLFSPFKVWFTTRVRHGAPTTLTYEPLQFHPPGHHSPTLNRPKKRTPAQYVG